MNQMRKVGLETGQLTDEELKLIDTSVVQTVYPLLVGRQIFPRVNLGDAGYTTNTYYRETDMSAATISMTGEGQVRDAITTNGVSVKLPVIHKDVKLHWRDVLGARRRAEPLDMANIRNAARQVAEEEDKLLLSGETALWKAMGIEGLTSQPSGGNTEASAGSWGTAANVITDIGDAMEEQFTDGYYGPYALILQPSAYQKMLAKYSGERSILAYVMNDMFIGPAAGSKVYMSTQVLAEDDGLGDSAILCQPGSDNFDMLVAQDITTFIQQDADMNLLIKVYEAVVPRIKRPASICEITGIT